MIAAPIPCWSSLSRNLDGRDEVWTRGSLFCPCVDNGSIVAVNQRREVVCRLGSGEVVPALPWEPVLSSAATPWSGVFLERHVAGSGVDTGRVAFRNHVVFIHEGPPSELEMQIGSEVVRHRMLAEHVGVIPAGVPFSSRTRSATAFVLISIEPRFLDGVALDLSGKGWVELTPEIGVTDPLVCGIAQALQAEAGLGAQASRLYGESLGAALAVHLAKNYAGGTKTLVEPRGGLTRLQLRTAMDYLHAHLGENIHLEDIARAAGMSPFHFSRRFRRSTGVPPHRYLVRLRVQRARELLLWANARLSDVAAQVGFYDQSHLATHFKLAFGITPSRFSAQHGGHRAPS